MCDWRIPTYTIIQKVKKGNKNKALFLATRIKNEVLIGYSMCHPKDKWDRFTAIAIAADRAHSWHNLKRDWKIPDSLAKDFNKFFDRCLRYYKGASITVRIKGQSYVIKCNQKKKKEVPFVAVSYDELLDIPCRKGDIAIITHDDGTEEECGVRYGTDTSGIESSVLSFIKTRDDKTYLVGINGKFLKANKKIRMKGDV